MDRFLIDNERFDLASQSLAMTVTPRQGDYAEADLIELGWIVMDQLNLRCLTVLVQRTSTEFEHRN